MVSFTFNTSKNTPVRLLIPKEKERKWLSITKDFEPCLELPLCVQLSFEENIVIFMMAIQTKLCNLDYVTFI